MIAHTSKITAPGRSKTEYHFITSSHFIRRRLKLSLGLSTEPNHLFLYGWMATLDLELFQSIPSLVFLKKEKRSPFFFICICWQATESSSPIRFSSSALTLTYVTNSEDPVFTDSPFFKDLVDPLPGDVITDEGEILAEDSDPAGVAIVYKLVGALPNPTDIDHFLLDEDNYPDGSAKISIKDGFSTSQTVVVTIRVSSKLLVRRIHLCTVQWMFYSGYGIGWCSRTDVGEQFDRERHDRWHLYPAGVLVPHLPKRSGLLIPRYSRLFGDLGHRWWGGPVLYPGKWWPWQCGQPVHHRRSFHRHDHVQGEHWPCRCHHGDIHCQSHWQQQPCWQQCSDIRSALIRSACYTRTPAMFLHFIYS